MGFYNIFKIIRLCLKDIFGYKTFRKILICIILIVFIVFIYTKVFAFPNDTILVDNQYTITLPSWYDDYYWYIAIGDGQCRIVISEDEFIVKPLEDGVRMAGTYNCGAITLSCDRTQNGYQNAINNKPTISSQTNLLLASGSLFHQSKFSNFTIFDDMGVHYKTATNPRVLTPILTNTQSQLENLSFNNFTVECRGYTNQDVYMLFYNRSLSNSQNTDGLYPISTKLLAPQSIYYNSTNSTEDNAIYTIPIWKTGVLFNVGSTYDIRFAIISGWNTKYDIPIYSYVGSTYTFTISSNVTQDYINQLNQQTATDTSQDDLDNINISIDNQTNAINNQTNAINNQTNAINNQTNAINNQTNTINNQTQSIDNINNSINNSTVDNSSIDLPTDNTQDPTQSGVDNIFQTIYNSFTSGNAQDIVFPIPFTQKSITLQANYLYNVLQNNNASWVVMIIQAFWWYLISRFIIKDIMKKIRKIKQGNFDNIQNDNIKEDML